MQNERNYGIDLLRLLLMFMVVVIHVINKGGALKYSSTSAYNAYLFLNCLVYSAVDGYALISGYVSKNKKKNYKKIVVFWLQVFFYSFGITLVINLLQGCFSKTEVFDLSKVLESMFPVLTVKYWYFTGYFFLLFFMPWIDKTVFNLDEKESKHLFLSLIIIILLMYLNRNEYLCSFLNNGFSFLWLAFLYALGILIRKINLFNNISSILLIAILLLLTVLTYLNPIYSFVNLLSYVSPTVLFSAIVLVVLFSRLNPNKKIVSFLSPLTLGVYLLHDHYYFRYYILEDSLVFFDSISATKGILVILAYSFAIFCAGLIVEFIRQKIFKLLKIETYINKILMIIEKDNKTINI